MSKKIFSIVLFVLVYNLIFYLQNYLNSEFQIYLLGFRLNLFLLINLLIILINRDNLHFAKNYFLQIGNPKSLFLLLFIPFCIIGFTLFSIYIFGSINYKQPDFLVEFGFTSILDLPIYYLWTFPLTSSFIAVLLILFGDLRFWKPLISSFFITISFVAVKYDFLKMLNVEDFSYLALIFAFSFYHLLILNKIQSAWIIIFLFLISLYSYVLVFGSKNSFIIKTFFARTYANWDGLFQIRKFDSENIDLIFAGLMILFGLLFFIFDRKETKN